MVCVVQKKNNNQHSAEILKGPGQAARGLLTMVLCVINCSTDRLVNEDDLFKKLHHQIDNRVSQKQDPDVL